MEKDKTDYIYSDAQKIASNHYENFPVISLFIPKRFRKHVAIVYVFARQADDFADEGNFSAEQRLEILDEYENNFCDALKGKYINQFWHALYLTIESMNLNPSDFINLLKAFKQDIVKKRYKDFYELMDYCSNSANPVGRIILDIFNIKDEKLKNYSDKICTALQLTNFYQDVSIDYENGRIYIPSEELALFSISEKDFDKKINSTNFKLLIDYQIKRTQELFIEGSKLIQFLPNPLKFEIKWTVLGGQKILDKIRKIDYDVLNQRPILNKMNYFSLLIKALVDF